MTDEERKEAERLAAEACGIILRFDGTIWDVQDADEIYPIKMQWFVKGFAAAREATRAEMDSIADEYVVNDRLAKQKLEAERARSAKLLEALERISSATHDDYIRLAWSAISDYGMGEE